MSDTGDEFLDSLPSADDLAEEEPSFASRIPPEIQAKIDQEREEHETALREAREAGEAAAIRRLRLSQQTPPARDTDPDTSADAAASVGSTNVDGLRASQEAVLKVFLSRPNGLTDQEFVRLYGVLSRGDRTLWPFQSESGLRTRRHELTEAGYVKDSGDRRKLVSGRYGIVWKATP